MFFTKKNPLVLNARRAGIFVEVRVDVLLQRLNLAAALAAMSIGRTPLGRLNLFQQAIEV